MTHSFLSGGGFNGSDWFLWLLGRQWYALKLK